MDEVESYDTGVKCDECKDPSATSMRGGALARAATVPIVPVTQLHVGSAHGLQGRVVNTPSMSVARFGPAGCVSAWRNASSGNCVMRTECAPEVDLSTYEFGVLCVEPNATVTRHLFGRGAFNHQESFDTLIPCAHCLGLDSADALTVANLTARVGKLELEATNIAATVWNLNSAVEEIMAGASAAGAAPATTVAPAAPVALHAAGARRHKEVKVTTVKTGLRHSDVKRAQEQDDDDSDTEDDQDMDYW